MLLPICFITLFFVGSQAVSIDQEQIENDEFARNYNSRYSIYDEPYNIEFQYHNYEQMSRFLRTTSLRFQNLTALYSIGKSVKGMTNIIAIQ